MRPELPYDQILQIRAEMGYSQFAVWSGLAKAQSQ